LLDAGDVGAVVAVDGLECDGSVGELGWFARLFLQSFFYFLVGSIVQLLF
jgi:hypothetical protein